MACPSCTVRDGASAHQCACGHLDVFHHFGARAGVQVRKSCGWTPAVGAQPAPCPCPEFTPKEET